MKNTTTKYHLNVGNTLIYTSGCLIKSNMVDKTSTENFSNFGFLMKVKTFPTLVAQFKKSLLGFCVFVLFTLGTSLNGWGQNTNVPPSGQNFMTNNGTLYDGGGATANYGNNWNGYTVIVGRPGQTITLSGTYALETCNCDYIEIYSSNISGAITYIQSYVNGSGSISYMGAIGASVVVRFDSDVSVVAAGFTINVTYSGAASESSVDVTGSKTLSCLKVPKNSTTLIYDHGGLNGDYGNNRNDAIYFDATPTDQISISGVCITENNYDYVYIRNYAGAILATYTNFQQISYTGAIGQTLILQFTSDGSTTSRGFAVNVKYTSTGSLAETNPLLVTPNPVASCNTGTFRLGSGAYYDLNVNTNTYYNFTFAAGSSPVSGFTASPLNGNATAFSTNQVGWYSGTTTSLRVNTTRNNCWNSTSAVMTYRNTTPTQPINTPTTLTVVCASDYPVAIAGEAATNGVSYWQGNTNDGTSTSTPGSINNATAAGNWYYRPYNNGCWGTQQVTRISNATIPTDVTIGVSPAMPVCAGTDVTLTANSPAADPARYRLVLKSAHGAAWHGIQEIIGRNSAGVQQALICTGASSATYTDNFVSAGNYRASFAFDGDATGTATSGIQWLTPEQSNGTMSSGGTLPNTNWRNYATFNPFFTPEWIEFDSPDILTELDIYNGRNDGNVTSCFNDYVVYVSYNSGTSWMNLSSGSLTSSPRLNTINIEPTYTWKRGATTVGTGKTLNLNNITVAQGGAYTLELGYGCSIRTINTTITVNPVPTATITTNNPTICHGNSATLSGTVSIANSDVTIDNGVGAITASGTTWSATVTPTATTTYSISSVISGACPGTGTGSTTVTLPAKSGTLSTIGEAATCPVSGSNWVHFYHPTSGNLIGSVNANGGNLGNVTLQTGINAGGSMFACNTGNNPLYQTAYMGRNWHVNSSAYPSSASFASPAHIRLPYSDAELTNMNNTASTVTTGNPLDDNAARAQIMLTKISGGSVNGNPTDDCTATILGIAQSASNTIASVYSGMTTSGNYADFTVAQFSEMFLHKNINISPLPVTLTNFSASCDKNVTLNWTTASEQNSDRFIIQKSRDASEWEVVDEVSAAGNSNTTRYYDFTDANSWNAISYYRLKQIDFNGEQEVYGPISVSCQGNENTMTVYPNPNSGSFTIEISSDAVYADAQLVLTDMTGKVIISQKVNIAVGTTQILMNNLELQMGTYLVTLRGADQLFKPVKVTVF